MVRVHKNAEEEKLCIIPSALIDENHFERKQSRPSKKQSSSFISGSGAGGGNSNTPGKDQHMQMRSPVKGQIQPRPLKKNAASFSIAPSSIDKYGVAGLE